MNIPKFLTSSVDANQLSMTVKGILLAIIPIVMVFTGLTEEEVGPITDGIVQFVFLAASLWSGTTTLIGLVRKAHVGRWSAK